MSLVRLLTTGKSLVGLNGETHRYEMRSKNLLPKFISPKNPFQKTAAAEQEKAVMQPVSEPASQPRSFQRTPAEIAAAKLKETKRLPSAMPMKTEQQPNEAKAPAKSSQWKQMFGFLMWWNNRKTKPSAIPHFNKAPQQTELSLDKIRVVRNDLNDADVEVVPMKVAIARARISPAPAPIVAAEPELAIPDLPPATKSWELLGEQMMAKK